MKCDKCGRWLSSRQIVGNGTLCPACYAAEAVSEAQENLTNTPHNNLKDVTVQENCDDRRIKCIAVHRNIDGTFFFEAGSADGKYGQTFDSKDHAFIIAKLKEMAQLIGNADET